MRGQEWWWAQVVGIHARDLESSAPVDARCPIFDAARVSGELCVNAGQRKLTFPFP